MESAVEYESICDGHSTALFVPAVDGAGRVVGGLRVQGRLTRSDQAHAVTEWAGRPGTAQMCGQITARIPYGVIEVKTVWVDSTFEGRTALTSALSRAFVHVMDLLQVRFALCTAAGHAVTRWQASGGVVSRDVPAVAYPDERYRTVLMWWDRIRIADLVSADQLDAMTRESAALSASVATVPTASVA